MTTTFIPEGMFARYYVHPTSTKVIVTDGRSAVQTELKTGKPTQAECHDAIERCCGKLLKTTVTN